MTKREVNRKVNAETSVIQTHLKNQISLFLSQTKGLTEAQIYDLFNEHDAIWQQYAYKINAGSNKKIVLVMPDSFEDAIITLHKELKNIKGIPENELAYYKHIAEMFRPSTAWEKLIRAFKKIFN